MSLFMEGNQLKTPKLKFNINFENYTLEPNNLEASYILILSKE